MRINPESTIYDLPDDDQFKLVEFREVMDAKVQAIGDTANLFYAAARKHDGWRTDSKRVERFSKNGLLIRSALAVELVDEEDISVPHEEMLRSLVITTNRDKKVVGVSLSSIFEGKTQKSQATIMATTYHPRFTARASLLDVSARVPQTEWEEPMNRQLQSAIHIGELLLDSYRALAYKK